MSDEIGEFVETPGEYHGEWRIPNFLSLPNEVGKCYWSPTFQFADTCWSLRIYPSGSTDKKSDGWINLYLFRMDFGPPRTISYSFGIRKTDGTEEVPWKKESQTFLKEKGGWGTAKFLERSDLQSRESDLAPSGTLTVTCTLKSDRQCSTDASLFTRLWNTSLSLKHSLDSSKRPDVVLKLKDGEIPVHSVILESRSTAFRHLFDAHRKGQEKKPKGLQRMSSLRGTKMAEVNIEDWEKAAYSVVLSYIYSGEPEGLNTNNVYEVFQIAHKYDLKELMKLCMEFMHECLSVDVVCGVIAIAEMYQETELKKCAKDFFVNNAAEVFKTKGWKLLKEKNSAIVSELLECLVLEKASKTEDEKECKTEDEKECKTENEKESKSENEKDEKAAQNVQNANT